METPKLKLKNKTYTAQRPTMGVWRQVVEYDETKKDGLIEAIDGHMKILSVIYDIPVDEIQENIDIADVIPSYLAAAAWVINLTYEKMKAIPKNADAGQDKEQN